jgi:hypothetical protein
MADANDHGKGVPRQPRKRVAKGPPRPRYLDSTDLDKLTIMFVAMVSEMLAIRDRVDTHEVLLERDGKLTADAIEAFRPSGEQEDVREQKRLAMMRRIFRVLRDELETDGGVQPPAFP